MDLNNFSTVWAACGFSFGTAMLGGVFAKFRPFLLTEDEADAKLKLHRSTVIEQVAINHNNLFRTALEAPLEVPLRGKPPEKPDLLVDYTKSLECFITEFNECRILHNGFKDSYNFLFFFSFMGILQFILAFVLFACDIILNYGVYISFVAIFEILIELCLYWYLRTLGNRLRRLIH